MSDGDALLRAILMNPADDVARLVYADWLQENGHGDRAALIRLGVEIGGVEMRCQKKGLPLSHMWPHAEQIGPLFVSRCRCRPCSLARAEFCVACELAESHGTEEEMRFAAIGAGFRRRRGFVSEIRLRLESFMTHAKWLFSAHPIERVTLTDRLTSGDEYPEEGNSLWRAWFRDGTPAQSMWPNFRYYLPAPIFDRLSRGSLELNALGTQGLRRYQVYQRPAYPDLSLACVAYGRSLAGLPALLPVPLSRAM